MLFLYRSWIILGALLAAGGWLFSALGALNRTGYLALFALAMALIVWSLTKERPRRSFYKLRRRLAHPAPLLYLALALLAILGGFLYPPVNVDGYAYRIPRVLHWISEQRWHWIHTADVRLNVVASGFDWLCTPLLLFAKSERALPLVNAISFLLLPGAVFMVLSRLGLRKRVAWWWMWIIPAGFCYCMQAGSIANDMFAALYSLGAIGFGLRACASRNIWDLWTSALALALATAAKQTNLPFGLPWLIAIGPALPLIRGRLLPTLLILALAAASSILPSSFLNLANGVPWSGFERGRDYAPDSPFWGIVGNAFWVTFSNLQPPIVPWAAKWNALRMEFLASDYGAPFRSFEVFGYLYRAASEQYSGVGCTVLLFALLSWLVAKFTGPRKPISTWNRAKWIRITAWLGFVIFLAKIGINQNPRYLAPYYPFLLSSFLLSQSHGSLTRQMWWRRAACVVICLSIALIVLSRQRPLFPAETLITALRAKLGPKSFLQKVQNSYTFANSLRYEMEPFVAKIPVSENPIGYAVRFGDKEPWLWKPLFHRKVLRVLNSDSPEQLRASGLNYVVVDRSVLFAQYDPVIVAELPSPRSRIASIAEWLDVYQADLVATAEIRIEPDARPEKIYLTRLRK